MLYVGKIDLQRSILPDLSKASQRDAKLVRC